MEKLPEINKENLPMIRAMAEQLPGGFFIYHADGNEEFILINSALLRITGCKTEEEFKKLTNNSFRGFVHSDEIEETEKSIVEQINHSEYELDYVEYHVKKLDGTLCWIRDYGHFAHTKDFGDVFYVFVDDSTLKNMEEKKKQSDFIFHRTDAILHAVTEDYVCLIDVDLVTEKEVQFLIHQDILQRWSEAQNYTTCIGAYAEKIVSAEDRERFKKETEIKTIKAYLQSHPEFIIEYDALINGDRRKFQGRFTLSKDITTSPHMFVGIRDLTDSEKIRFNEQKEMEAARQKAEEANKVKTTFLFNMSHDIRTPMNAIIGFSNLMEKNIDNKAVCLDYIKKIQQSSSLLLELINNVLEMARIENGKIKLEETKYHLDNFENLLSSVFELQMKEKNLKFVRNIDIQHYYVWCDALKLKEIVLNIVGNAYKYTNAGGSIFLSLKEIPSEKSGWATYKMEIEDTGIGMAEEFLPHIFDNFSRERNSTESRVQGSGLGMSIVKAYVELMGGTIEVESQVRKGTKFTVTISHRIVTEAEAEDEKIITEDLNVSFKGKRILLVEDNDLNAEIAVAILDELGIETERAADGLKCIERLTETVDGYYDLILMDIQMPKLNGFETTTVIRQLEDKAKADIPIIAMTANAFEEDKQKSLKCGMNGHVAKPIDVKLLIKELARILG